MKILVVILVVLLTVATFALEAQAQQRGVRVVYRLAPGTQAISGAKKITFGLTPDAANKLHTLTRGQVDFRNIYALDVTNVQAFETAKNQRGYQGFIRPNVPPPALIGTGDPQFAKEWWVKKHNVEAAWALATGKNIVIADCDAGYYLSEPDIHTNMLSQFRYSFAVEDDPLEVEIGGYVFHGTAVAAIMSGVLNQAGTNGIAPHAKTIPLQNYSYSPRDKLDKEEATARCILGAMKIPQVRIIVLENQTLNGSSETYVGTREAVKLALGSGITIVSAGGNYSKQLTIEAENDTGSIIVGALNPDESMADFSNYGTRISVSAFGSNLNTLCGPNGKFCSFGGTSGATPQVAAAVALMLEANPRLQPEQIRQILVKTRRTLASNALVGGTLNLVGAVQLAKDTPVSSEIFARRLAIRRQVVQILKEK